MKLIFKIDEYYPETNQFSLRMCKQTSRKPIDQHKKTLLDLNKIDHDDCESFIHALVARSGDTRIKEDNELETVLPENNSEVITGDFNIQDMVGKIIQGEIHEWYGLNKSILKMKRIYTI